MDREIIFRYSFTEFSDNNIVLHDNIHKYIKSHYKMDRNNWRDFMTYVDWILLVETPAFANFPNISYDMNNRNHSEYQQIFIETMVLFYLQNLDLFEKFVKDETEILNIDFNDDDDFNNDDFTIEYDSDVDDGYTAYAQNIKLVKCIIDGVYASQTPIIK